MSREKWSSDNALMASASSGKCYIVATPIGNITDITLRALEVLGQVAFVACEDTRQTRGLLDKHGVNARLISCHEHNEDARVELLSSALARGEDVAVVSDAGTPLISDPGFVLVRALAARGFTVEAVPGSCALVAALSISGLPTDRFIFEGFLPARQQARRERMQQVADEERTLVFYEAPHRITDFAADALMVFGGERPVVHARELTKLHEQVYRGTAAGWCDWLALDANRQRGEMVVLIGGASRMLQLQQRDHDWLLAMRPHLQTKELAKLAAKITGLPKADLYNFLIGLK